MVRSFVKCLFALLVGLPLGALAQKLYSIDTAWFKNPERGFFEWVNSHRLPSDSTHQSFWRLIAAEPDSISLVYEEFVLHDFKTSDISQAYLDMMQAEFNNLRAYGMKAIVRFCYVTSSDWDQTVPPDTTGTDIGWMLTHIRQIQPVIRNNIDVIAYFQAGFMGRWGEWGGGSGTIGNAFPDYSRDTAAQAALLRGLLSMVPPSRMIDVRAPRYKFWFLRDTGPLSLDDWWSGTPKARIGEHNDAFHKSQDDAGTFYDYNIHDTSFFRPWYKTETKFGGIIAEQDGEWNSPYDPGWFADLEGWFRSFVQPMGRENAEMANQHVMSIQLQDQDWSAGMKSRGYWNILLRRLGYRFQLISSQFPQAISSGGPLRIRLRLTNVGWSSPRNPRGLELILRRDSSGAETVINLFRHKDPRLDPRLWWPGDTVQIDTSVILPGSMTPGTYSAFVALPDTFTSIRRRPEYSVRLANRGVWEPLTGYNNLGTNVIVTDGPLAVQTDPVSPPTFIVEQNYPNPFNPVTTIWYTIPKEGNVTVEIFNALGQRVKTLVSEFQPAGRHSVVWSGENDAGAAVGTGIYLYRVKAGLRVAVRKMALVH